MKYLLGFAALSIGALAQHELPSFEGPQEEPHRPENFHPLEKHTQPEAQIIIDQRDPLIQQPEISPEWAIIDNGIYPPGHPNSPHEPDQRMEEPERKHHKRQHIHERPDQNDMADSAEGWNRGPRDEFNGPMQRPGEQEEGFQNEHEERESCHHGGRKFMRGKGFGHVVVFLILAVLSIFLVKKCISKRKDRRRCQQGQSMTDPSMIDDKINSHYAEIQRLNEMKNQMQRQVQEPIIYHQTYPQDMQMGNVSNGRMVNENSYPVNPPQHVQQQQIPVGRPVIINNPYNHQQIYRANQY